MKKCTPANNRIFVVCAGLAKIEQQYENISYFYNAKTLIKRATVGFVQRAVLRERGCMPADTFVLIFKRVARPNLCDTPACVKPPPRYRQAGDSNSAVGHENAKIYVNPIILTAIVVTTIILYLENNKKSHRRLIIIFGTIIPMIVAILNSVII